LPSVYIPVPVLSIEMSARLATPFTALTGIMANRVAPVVPVPEIIDGVTEASELLTVFLLHSLRSLVVASWKETRLQLHQVLRGRLIARRVAKAS